MISPPTNPFLFFALATVVLAGSAGAQPAQIEKVATPPPLTPLAMHTGGRMLALGHEPGALPSYRLQWPGVYFTAAFSGTEVYFATGREDVILHVLVDDQQAVPLVKPGAGIFRVGGLASGDHSIRVEVVSENQAAPVQFGGFALAAGTTAGMPTRAVRQIEFIGDSHTVGYGNTYPQRECTPEIVWATTDNAQAFGPLVAKSYHADYQINAISGRGIVRNYDGGPGDPLPVAYPYVLFDKQVVATDPTWQPTIIVVALGNNDFSTPLHAGEKWRTREELHADYEQTYVQFIQRIRAGNPGAFFILVGNDTAEGEIAAEVQRVIGRLEAAGEKRVGYVAFNHLELTACDWHPSLKDHQMMASTLRQFIDARPELWSGR